jgi:hypothetical protein
MIKNLVFTCFSICWTLQILGQNQESRLHSPLDIPLKLSANFGELRSNHFHMGLDFKTNKKEGYSIFSIDDGYVSRVRISPNGYGKVIYVNHPNGLTSVYAHCSKFNTAIDSIMVAIQMEQLENEVDVFFRIDEIKVQAGDLIAYSGNSGHSQGPHLHFEIRNTETQKALNPLLFGFKIADHISPEINSLRLYSLTQEGYNIPGKIQKLTLPAEINGKINLADTLVIQSNFLCEDGYLGFSFEMQDRYDGESNLCGIYASRLEIDDQLEFCQAIDSIDFIESRYINNHMDYSAFTNEKRHFHKTFRTEENPLDIYPCDQNGIKQVEANTVYKLVFSANDLGNNNTTLNLKFQADSSSFMVCGNIFPPEKFLFPDSSYVFENEKIRFLISKNTFYEPVLKNVSLNGPFSIGDAKQPIQKTITVSLKSPEINSEKYYIEVATSGGVKKALKSEILNGWITAESEYLGIYSLKQDKTAPTIVAHNFKIKDQKITSSEIYWKIGDTNTSIKSYNLYVDGIWKPVYYDNKTNTIGYVLPKYFSGDHQFKVIVSDPYENRQVWEATLNMK